jgi:protein gp37
MHPDWVRSLRDQCQDAGVPFFFGQWGEWGPYVDDEKFTRGGAETGRNAQTWLRDDGEQGVCWIYDDDGTWQNHCGDPGEDMSRVAVLNRWGKKRAGRMLDGRTWDEFPQAVQA